ncbi:G1 family glutamic endopeptidase [Kitasatospora sp. NPDC097691]|uniref:G1 family glutamic endopeptidase n=1 Tax=Kitasatospora sp. NPDC097691 TaxID=3157231 RepID=UPI0033288539
MPPRATVRPRSYARSRSYDRSLAAAAALLLFAPLTATLIATTPAVTAASGASTPAGTPAASFAGITSGNWSGYASTGTTYHSVTASWTQPRISCTAVGAVSIWVGLDGQGTSTVEQTGTQAECTAVNATPHYFAWWENYPDPESPYRDSVRPGDTMTASVEYDHAQDAYTAKLTDETLGWTETKSFPRYSGATNGSAEVIAEAPNRNGSRQPLANFGSVTFTHAAIDGRTLAAASAATVTMARNGVTEAVAGPLSTGGDSFTDTWKHS